MVDSSYALWLDRDMETNTFTTNVINNAAEAQIAPEDTARSIGNIVRAFGNDMARVRRNNSTMSLEEVFSTTVEGWIRDQGEGMARFAAELFTDMMSDPRIADQFAA